MYDKYGFDSNRFNKNGYNIYGFDKNGLNKDGYDINGFDKNGLNKDGLNKYGYKKKDTKSEIENTKSKIENIKSKIKTSKAKSFKNQKGKGYVNLPILLSKAYTSNNTKKLISDIKQLVNNLYSNKQITNQVYNNLIKAITYKNDL